MSLRAQRGNPVADRQTLMHWRCAFALMVRVPYNDALVIC